MIFSQKEINMDRSLIDNYKNFLDRGKTERECVSFSIEMARAKGFVELCEKETLVPGDRVYYVNRDKSIALFIIGNAKLEEGLNILGAHIDSPRLDLKMKPLFEKEGVVYLNTHYYGGIKKYQWVTMPLAIHGVVFKKDGTAALVEIGEDEDDTALCISDILPHIAQDQMKQTAAEFIKGEELDLVVGLTPNDDSEEKDKGKKAIMAILKERYDIEEEDFISAELEVVPAGKARDMGLDRSMVLAYGQDDRVCAYTSLKAILDYEGTPERTACCLLVDKEEIGSVGATGMDSLILENTVAEILAKCSITDSLTLRRCLRTSYMLSSDVNSAYDPQHAELYDKDNSSTLSGGVVFNKYTGARGKSGASDANPEFIAKLRAVMDKNKVKFQMAEMAKVDIGGGGTIAKYCSWYGMDVIDCGVAVLSMH
nr:aminopeptidase [Sphaerochaetaceae bacterium]